MNSKFKILGKKIIHNGFFKMKEITLKYQKYDGKWSNEIKRELFGGAQVSAVLPYDPDNKKIVLIQQFRPGTISTKSNNDLYYGVHGDWETRRYFTSFSILDKKSSQEDYTENEFQIGIAPYLGEYNQLHTWIMLKSKEDTRDDKWKTYPFIKLFKGDFLLEVGSKESHWDLHLMKRF